MANGFPIVVHDSGKEKAHKHNNLSGNCLGEGVSRLAGQGSNVYVLCGEPKEHKHFRPGTRPFMCQNFSGTGIAGRPGHRTMEMIGRRTALYLVHTPRISFFVLALIGLEAKGLLAVQERRGIASVVRWNLRPVIFRDRSQMCMCYLNSVLTKWGFL